MSVLFGDMSIATASTIKRYIDHVRGISIDRPTTPAIICKLVLPSGHKSLAVAVIERTIDEMSITNQGKRNFYVYAQIKEMRERFRPKQRLQLFDENTLEPMDLVMDNMVAVKLEDDIDLIRHILTTTMKTLSLDGTYDLLNEAIDNVNRESRNEYKLIVDFIKSKIELDQLCQEIRAEAEMGVNKLQGLKDAIGDIQSDISESIIDHHIKLRLVDKWEETRFEQANRILQQNEDDLVRKICTFSVKKDREQIAAAEIENFNKFKIAQIQCKTTEWIQKYQEDTFRYDSEIKTTQVRISEVHGNFKVVRDKHAVRQVELDAFYEEQRLLAEKRAFEEQLCRKAIRIQAWWRGVMVRRQLGPYRPKKKGKKGKSKK